MRMPMFPLGSVLFPGQVLPLRVFEPRYRAMVRDLVEADGRFGVVLIERGFEVGGGDVRSDVGCVAQIVQLQPHPDGRFALVAVGVERLRVTRWLPDDPYPVAEVEIEADRPADPGLDDRYRALVARIRVVLALVAELGRPAAPATLEFVDDVGVGTFQVAAASPLGPLDRQRVLGAAGATERLALLEGLLAEEEAFLRAHVAMEAPPEASD